MADRTPLPQQISDHGVGDRDRPGSDDRGGPSTPPGRPPDRHRPGQAAGGTAGGARLLDDPKAAGRILRAHPGRFRRRFRALLTMDAAPPWGGRPEQPALRTQGVLPYPPTADFPVSWSSHLDNADVAAALFDRPDIPRTIAVVEDSHDPDRSAGFGDEACDRDVLVILLTALLAATFPDGRHTIERLTPVGTDEALLYRRFTGTAFLGAVTAGARVDFVGTDLFAVGSGTFTAQRHVDKTCSPSRANCARTTADHDRVTGAGQQAAAASRKLIRPPLPSRGSVARR
ncbi:hypothetical protein [Streptomyces sp. NPDC006335]|uniref:hypothetical protein n=1 Tax=Streptomyces sp. NPDC006335 TaxID=3156895 RepID=UPI0033B0F0C8